jgi:RNA polymerase sigma factor (sigma-70 family)
MTQEENLDQTTVHVRAAIQGSTEDLGWVFERVGPLLSAQVNLRLGKEFRGRIAPEDIIADAWLIAIPALSDLKARKGRYTPVLLSYLSTSCVNIINNQIRALLRQGIPEGDGNASETVLLDRLAGSVAGVVTDATNKELSIQIAEAIQSLPDRDHQVVVHRAIEGQAIKTIAEKMELEPDTVSQVYRRAVQKLRNTLPNSVFDEFAPE